MNWIYQRVETESLALGKQSSRLIGYTSLYWHYLVL